MVVTKTAWSGREQVVIGDPGESFVRERREGAAARQQGTER